MQLLKTVKTLESEHFLAVKREVEDTVIFDISLKSGGDEVVSIWENLIDETVLEILKALDKVYVWGGYSVKSAMNLAAARAGWNN
jgi:hypothetical protein